MATFQSIKRWMVGSITHVDMDVDLDFVVVLLFSKRMLLLFLVVVGDDVDDDDDDGSLLLFLLREDVMRAVDTPSANSSSSSRLATEDVAMELRRLPPYFRDNQYVWSVPFPFAVTRFVREDNHDSFPDSTMRSAVFCETWIRLGIPVDSILAAVLTVSPNN